MAAHTLSSLHPITTGTKSTATGEYQLASDYSSLLTDFVSGNEIPSSAIIIDIPDTHTTNITDILPPYSEYLNDGPNYKARKRLPHAVPELPRRKKPVKKASTPASPAPTPVLANTTTSKLPKATTSCITAEDRARWAREGEEHAVKLGRVRAAMSMMGPRIGRVSP
ncbi:hypothetical protein DACRYDRAFT_117360 [Dacryopinax primogenitus]|uniref:Uncharacterized protein n=1 Tax=Dacryopinax primogenitus (strain DJM 731) TaxID=1858805 RepID=M5G3A5_DACPD|nr:uncharacterized protein DACRYDRAFT_117360 [Dacryopinax primogenitus]EJU00362.1 hypothetical protein DACRYDRAFT_117360 [Dacryopinax primogenitus]